MFESDAPLEIDVGSGKGLFLFTAAASCPQHNFLGIELAGKFARFAAAKLARQNIDNARVVHADALRVFREILPDESVAAVHVYFPDPWWKKRHKKRRVMTAMFVRDVARALSAGGHLHFWTDVREYFETTLDLIAQETQLAGPQGVDERPAAHDMDFLTHFERRTRLGDRRVYRALFCRKSPPGEQQGQC